MENSDTRLPPADYLSSLRRDAARIMAVVDGADLGAQVPTCPGWTLRDVVEHTGEAYLEKVASMRAGTLDVQVDGRPHGDLTVWFEEALAVLLSELASRGPDAPTATWWPPEQTVGFWYRRMAQETAVHRVDAEGASGDVTPVDDALALDGIDEVLIFLSDWPLEDEVTGEPVLNAGPPVPAGNVPDTQDEATGLIVAVRTGDHCWRVALEADRVDVRSGPGSADATVTGEPSELLLWLWGRRPDSAVLVSGEASAVTLLRRRLLDATQ